MNRRTARALHASTNLTFWMENPNWHSGDAAFDLVCKGMQALPFSVHETQKRAFFDATKVLAVNGETVVAINNDSPASGLVDKFMFRYPEQMPTKKFGRHVSNEVRAVTTCLAGVSLPTSVGIKTADVFKHVRKPIQAVAQTQLRLNLDTHPAMNFSAVVEESPSPQRDMTARHLGMLLGGTHRLIHEYGFYPDIGYSSGNLRRSNLDGSVTLLDVMPFYADGNRLIGDNPPNIIPGLTESIRAYEAFVGQYGG